MPGVLDYSGPATAACDKRRRRAALRDSVEAAPVRLLRDGDFIHESSGRLKFSLGTLPETDEEALGMINLPRLARGDRPLRLARPKLGHASSDRGELAEQDREAEGEEVFIHYAEAANNRFIGDRFMFLHETTLRNVATGGAHGIAFLNSHRSGGLSEPTELPFGYTFSGRYEEHELTGGEVFRRTLLGIYMIKGARPNGSGGPPTDDLSRGIDAGTIRDVSMGLSGGSRICDVCGVDLEERNEKGRYVCPHAPGTDEEMEEEQREGQMARGVAKGYASYSLVDAYPNEVSAVYKGAVPGAGFRKSLELSHDPGFRERRGREVLAAYGPLLTIGERLALGGRAPAPTRTQIGGFPTVKLKDLVQAAREGDESAGEMEFAVIQAAPKAPPVGSMGLSAGSRAEEAPPAGHGSKAAPTAHEGLSERDRNSIVREARLDAREYLATMAGKFSPHEVDSFTAAYALAMLDDAERPAINPMSGEPVKRVDLVKAMHEHRGESSSGLVKGAKKGGADLVGSTPVVKPGETALPHVEGPDPEAAKRERTFANLAGSEQGRIILANDMGPEGKQYLAAYLARVRSGR
jgi:hypothetical protein